MLSKYKTLASLALVLAANTVQAQSFSGDFALSYGNAGFINTDDDEFQDGSAYSVSGNIGTTIGDYRIFGDFSQYRRDIGSETFDNFAPGGASAIGLHGGRQFGNLYAGAFFGKNYFQGSDAPATNGYVDGTLYGIDLEYKLQSVNLFAQVGSADMNGDVGDTQFVGNFYRTGFSTKLDRYTFTGEYEFGKSPDNFEDTGDWGTYKATTFTVEYDITDKIIGSLSYNSMRITANTEDSGQDDFLSVGIRIPLGGATARNNLTTSYRPGLAAAWAETLD